MAPDCGVVPADETDNDSDGSRVCAGDCADNDALRYPGADEQCQNRADDNCDGQIDEGC